MDPFARDFVGYKPTPELTPDEVTTLAPLLPWDDVESPRHGDDLGSLMGGFEGDWLEAAVLAGWVPTLQGIHLALLGNLMLEVRYLESAQPRGSEHSSCHSLADVYRDLIRSLQSYFEEQEHSSANGFRDA
jgi:hypothetical protein